MEHNQPGWVLNEDIKDNKGQMPMSPIKHCQRKGLSSTTPLRTIRTLPFRMRQGIHVGVMLGDYALLAFV